MKSDKVLPKKLSNTVSSYFTDLDSKDTYFDKTATLRNLKLQILTKEKIVIAASSLFDVQSHNIFSNDAGLQQCLQKGIILPAIRNTFENVNHFFVERRGDIYTNESEIFFSNNVKSYVSWDLTENTSWFKEKFYKGLDNPESLLRERNIISENVAKRLIDRIEGIIQRTNSSFLTVEHIEKATNSYNSDIKSVVNQYAKLIYRVSGARVVNSEGHFPQSNLTSLASIKDGNNITSSDYLLHDENIFWDMYVEAVISHIHSAAVLTIERLDRLSFEDVLKIRESISNLKFSKEYNDLILNVKGQVSFDDIDSLILKQDEIFEVAERLRVSLKERIIFECGVTDIREKALSEFANQLSSIYSSKMKTFMGYISLAGTVMTITAPVTKPLIDEIKFRLEYMQYTVNDMGRKLGLSQNNKKSLLSAYKQLVNYGIN